MKMKMQMSRERSQQHPAFLSARDRNWHCRTTEGISFIAGHSVAKVLPDQGHTAMEPAGPIHRGFD
jgi:hypothetical protein